MSVDLWRELSTGGGRIAQPDAAPAEPTDLWRELSIPPPAPQAAPAERPPPKPSFLQSLGMGLNDPIVGLGQNVGRGYNAIRRTVGLPEAEDNSDAYVAQRERAYQDRRGPDAGIDWGRMGGNVLSGVPLALATRNPQSLLGAVGSGIGQGAVMGGLQPVVPQEGESFAARKGAQIVEGGLSGAVGGAGGYLLGRAIAPQIPQNVRTLREAGVETTPGQTLGGLAQSLEDKARSTIPVMGDSIAAGQRNAVETFNRAVGNRVLAPIGEKLPKEIPAGRDMVAHVDDAISRVYDSALSKVRPFGPDEQFVADLQSEAQRFMTPESRAAFLGFVRDKVMSRLGAGEIDGRAFKTVDTEIGEAWRRYAAATSPADIEIKDGLRGLQMAMRNLLERTNGEAVPELKGANQAFARFVRLENAAGRVGSTEGVFSPQQFAAAVRQTDRSARHGAYARGEALMQDLSDPARAVLPSTIPDSGTAGRLMNAAALSGLATGAIPPEFAIPAAVGSVAYQRPVSNAISGLLAMPRSAPVGLLGDAVASSGGALSLPLAAMMFGAATPQRTQ